jgi:hypothetical protein
MIENYILIYFGLLTKVWLDSHISDSCLPILEFWIDNSDLFCSIFVNFYVTVGVVVEVNRCKDVS